MGRTRKGRLKMTKVLEAWTLLEMLNPGEVPSTHGELDPKDLKIKQPRKRVVNLSQYSKIQELELAWPAGKTKYYRYYMNTYRKDELILLLRKYFKSDEELINRQKGSYYSFRFDVNEQEEYIEGSLFVPQVQLIIDDIQNRQDISYADFSERYENHLEKFQEEFDVIMAGGVTEERIQEAQETYLKYFSLISKGARTSYVECIILNKETALNSNNFTSFFLEDLQRMIKNGPNETLARFIQGAEMEVDIDENREAIEATLAIDHLPLGRWPSPVNHRLSLMQQVAINQVLNGEEKISSVNGPPGTGKTTLLKDIFAHLIVERAIQMATYQDPTKAFEYAGEQNIKYERGTEGYDFNIYDLDPKIAQYSMVVASSNNGAVENLSKELPLLKEVIRTKAPTEKERKKQLAAGNIDPIIFHQYDLAYAEEAKNLAYFTDYAEDLLNGEEAWGLFSGAFGNSTNIYTISQVMHKKTGDAKPFYEYLDVDLPENAWEDAVNEFNTLRAEIEQDQANLEDDVEKMEKAEAMIAEANELPHLIEENYKQFTGLETTYQELNTQNDLLGQQLANLPKPSFIEKIQAFFGQAKNEEETEIRRQRSEVLKQLSEKLHEKNRLAEKIERLEQKKEDLDKELLELKQIQEVYKDQEVTLSTDEFWAKDHYEERQTAVLWQTHEMNFKRGMLFLKALKVHQIFLQKNHARMKITLTMLQHMQSNNLNIRKNRENMEKMWKVLHLIFPVMSTTFASFGSMYRGIGADFIDYLFIDEAGQASPQAAAGALWRSKRAIIVGDPIQIEPVVTLDETILSDIREAFNVSTLYIGPTASVQTIADHANPIGTYKGQAENRERIGIPLWVHRRCIEPMFSIANKMAYENKMVLATHGKEKPGSGEWHEVTGKAAPAQYVKEQGLFIVEELKSHFEKAAEKDELPDVFIITPFTAVSSQLIRLVNTELKNQTTNIWSWTKRSIGTVHTFQGKEADIVYFVTGTDDATDGAANWSCMKPNLLNVATTRAKKEFYVVGDFPRFKDKQYYSVIVEKFEKFNKEA